MGWYGNMGWGSMTDGSVDQNELLESINKHFGGRPIDGAIQIWRFEFDVAPRDVTEDFIRKHFPETEPTDEDIEAKRADVWLDDRKEMGL